MAAGEQAAAAEEAAAALGLETGDAEGILSEMQGEFERRTADIKDHMGAELTKGSGQPIPIARLRRLAKCDGTVTCNLGSEMLQLLGRATDALVRDLAARSAWFAAQRHRRIVHCADVVSGVDSDRRYDFLLDVVTTLPGANEPSPSDTFTRAQLRESGKGSASKRSKQA